MTKQTTTKPAKIRRFKRSQLEEFLCVVPAVALLILLTYYPLAELVRISFTDWNMLRKDYSYVGFTNWKWFIENAHGNSFFSDMLTTLKYTAGSLAIGLGGGLLFALLFGRLNNRQFSLMRSLIYLPHYIAMSTGGVLFLWILNKDYGILNNILNWAFGIRINWLNSTKWAMVSIWLVHAWHSIGYSMMIYLSAMTGIDQGYYEAASLDGASRSQKFFNITIPLLSPTILFLLVTQFIGSMKVFNSIDIMTQGGPYKSTEVITYLIYDLAFQRYRFDRSAVVSIVFFLFLLIVTVCTMQWSENKVTYDA